MDDFISVYFIFKNSNTFEIWHSLLTSSGAIFRYGWGYHIHHKSTNLGDKAHLYNSGSTFNQTAKNLIPEKLLNLAVD